MKKFLSGLMVAMLFSLSFACAHAETAAVDASEAMWYELSGEDTILTVRLPGNNKDGMNWEFEISNPEALAFSLAQFTIPFDASTWVTLAPALAAAQVAPPVYANKFNTLIGRFAFLINSENQSQLVACSGKRPVCLKLKGFK